MTDSKISAVGQFGYVDVCTWPAIYADTKLVPSFMVGPCDVDTAKDFINNLRSRFTHRVQLTADGHKAYLEAVGWAFGADIHFAVLVKIYGVDPEKERRYSPTKCIGAERIPMTGKPGQSPISTSYVERQKSNNEDDYAQVYAVDRSLFKES